MIPSASSSTDLLDFKWSIKELTTKSIELELVFENPEMVSIYEEKDYLKVQFFNTHQFMMDKNSESINILPSGYAIVFELPRFPDTSSTLVLNGE